MGRESVIPASQLEVRFEEDKAGLGRRKEALGAGPRVLRATAIQDYGGVLSTI